MQATDSMDNVSQLNSIYKQKKTKGNKSICSMRQNAIVSEDCSRIVRWKSPKQAVSPRINSQSRRRKNVATNNEDCLNDATNEIVPIVRWKSPKHAVSPRISSQSRRRKNVATNNFAHLKRKINDGCENRKKPSAQWLSTDLLEYSRSQNSESKECANIIIKVQSLSFAKPLVDQNIKDKQCDDIETGFNDEDDDWLRSIEDTISLSPEPDGLVIRRSPPLNISIPPVHVNTFHDQNKVGCKGNKRKCSNMLNESNKSVRNSIHKVANNQLESNGQQKCRSSFQANARTATYMAKEDTHKSGFQCNSSNIRSAVLNKKPNGSAHCNNETIVKNNSYDELDSDDSFTEDVRKLNDIEIIELSQSTKHVHVEMMEDDDLNLSDCSLDDEFFNIPNE